MDGTQHPLTQTVPDGQMGPSGPPFWQAVVSEGQVGPPPDPPVPAGQVPFDSQSPPPEQKRTQASPESPPALF